MGFSELFIDASSLPSDGYGFFQVLTLGLVYGYCLMYASNLISDGSELLLLVPSLAGIVGSVILPVLGAVPDGCIVLFSGLGDNAQSTLSVGVGALVGSTIMLLTIPWFLSVVGGRVHVKNGVANYKASKSDLPFWEGLHTTGVTIAPAIRQGSKFMLITSLSYLLLQVPGLIYLKDGTAAQAVGEKGWATSGIVFCSLLLSWYLYDQYSKANAPQNVSMISTVREEVEKHAILSKQLSLRGLLRTELQEALDMHIPEVSHGYQTEASSLQHTHLPAETMSRLRRLLKPFFNKYDKDGSGTLDPEELQSLFHDLGERGLTSKELKERFAKMDKDESNFIEFEEFVEGAADYILSSGAALRRPPSHGVVAHGHDDDDDVSPFRDSTESVRNLIHRRASDSDHGHNDHLDIEEEEDEEIPEDLVDLSPAEQQFRIKLRSLWMMSVGTLIVLMMADPMVEVLTELGDRTGISPFYISFVLAPLASNASEVIASYNYAQKKTSKTMAISLSALEGAAILNNTFVLGIFMIMIVVQGLAWEYFAETASVLFVQLAVAYMTCKKTHTIFDAFLILGLYPLSLALVVGLEYVGWD